MKSKDEVLLEEFNQILGAKPFDIERLEETLWEIHKLQDPNAKKCSIKIEELGDDKYELIIEYNLFSDDFWDDVYKMANAMIPMSNGQYPNVVSSFRPVKFPDEVTKSSMVDIKLDLLLDYELEELRVAVADEVVRREENRKHNAKMREFFNSRKKSKTTMNIDGLYYKLLEFQDKNGWQIDSIEAELQRHIKTPVKIHSIEHHIDSNPNKDKLVINFEITIEKPVL